VKFTPEQSMMTQRESRSSASTLSVTSVLDGVGGQCHAPTALLPVKTRYPLSRRLVGPQGRSGLVQKISSPTGIRSSDLPSRSESYADCAILAPNLSLEEAK
jgi:hypothetical protein